MKVFSLGNVIEMKILGPLLRLNESDTLGVDLSTLCFIKPSRSFYGPKFAEPQIYYYYT